MTVKLKYVNNEAFLNFKSNVDGNDDELNVDELLNRNVKKVFAKIDNAEVYSSYFVAEIFVVIKKISETNIEFDLSYLPKNIRDTLDLALKVQNIPPAPKEDVKISILENIGKTSYGIFKKITSALGFIHETNMATWRFLMGNAVWRKRDFWFIFGDCSYMAVEIVALVSFLVGLILAFVGAMQLKTFGAGIYVASMVAIGMTRIMAAIMVGIIMAGRTGSSYAATLGTMQVNEEIDALRTLGIKITDYLVVPRLIALVITIPFLTLLADVLGIFGGAVVGITFLDISSSSYFDYTIKALNLNNIIVGVLHGFIYGIIISLCGCYEGLKAGRNADSVGKATTGAVVKALVWMIVATGVLTVILQELGI